jgi:3D-(3,5/4)-trihydroxycyclohexane-1,2-dione acylhydrolase (decyclizing)
VIKNDRLHGVPSYDTWWEVAVPEVSEIDAVRAAREEYEEKRVMERYFLE